MNQVQTLRKGESEENRLEKAYLVVSSKIIRRCEANRNFWFVGSSSSNNNPKTPKKFYLVKFDQKLDAFVCDCKAYEFLCSEPCKHIIACTIFERSNDE
jgi:hypothetical protein